MMNLKKLGVLGIASCALLMTGCNREPADKVYRTIYYEEAKEWVKNNYGNDEPKEINPKIAKSEYAFGGYITRWSSDHNSTMQYLRNHMVSFLNQFCHINNEDEIFKTFYSGQDIRDGQHTTIADKNFSLDEYAYKTEKPFEISTGLSDFSELKYSNFDTYINFYFGGFVKKACDYIVCDTDKTMSIKGTYSYTQYDYNGNADILKIPNCLVSFNSKGLLSSIHFDFTSETTITYDWYNSSKSSYSDSFSFTALRNSWLYLDYIY